MSMHSYYLTKRQQEIVHFGIKRRSGRYPWGSGERPYQGDLMKGDVLVKKGTTVSRLSLRKNENVRGVRKYVSLQDMPEKKWKDLFTTAYAQQGYKYIFENQYKVVKDMPVASANTAWNLFDEFVKKNPDRMRDKILTSMSEWSKYTGAELGRYGLKTDFFRSLVYNSEANKEFFDFMKKQGYGAMADIYGITSGADKSIIVLDPDKLLKLKNQVVNKL